MLDQINWAPFIFTLQVFGAFILICLAAAMSDLWAKGSRRAAHRPRPVEWVNGEQVYLN